MINFGNNVAFKKNALLNTAGRFDIELLVWCAYFKPVAKPRNRF
jgi:hypothetical protein